MLERSPRDEVLIAVLPALPAWRPLVFFLSVGLTIAGLVWLAVIALSPGGFGAIDLILVLLFAVTLPWYVIGFWNATIGLLIMRFARDPVAAVTPFNGPANLLIQKVAPALAVGNAVVVKPSPPGTEVALLMAEAVKFKYLPAPLSAARRTSSPRFSASRACSRRSTPFPA